MLKLEKKSRRQGQGVDVVYYHKQQWFSSNFLMALSIAVLIHGGAFIIFHINPFTLSQWGGVLPKTVVEADLAFSSDQPEGDYRIFADPIEEELFRRSIFQPLLSQLSMPTMTFPALERKMEYFKEPDIYSNAFIAYEEDLMPSINMTSALKKDRQAFEINISGELADHQIIDNGLNELKELESFKTLSASSNTMQCFQNNQCRAIFSVRVETGSGKIFWYQALEIPQDEILRRVAENVLCGLLFEKGGDELFKTGEVEIVFSLNEFVSNKIDRKNIAG